MSMGMFGLMDTLFPIMFFTIFAIVIGAFIFTIVRGITTWHKNNNSPRLVVNAIVADKHEDVSVHHHNDFSSIHCERSASCQSYSEDRSALFYVADQQEIRVLFCHSTQRALHRQTVQGPRS